jgi:hypothetical protein
MSAPVQIILNADNFAEDRDAGGGGGPKKDFFLDRDRDFASHRQQLADEITAAADEIERLAALYGALGVVKVILKREAWAKTHRPRAALFKKGMCELVGGLDLGEMLVEADPVALRRIAREVLAAEDRPEFRNNEKTGKLQAWPTQLRHEVGAIERVELYGPADRRKFSVEQALSWLSNPLTGSSYQVELFETPPPIAQWDALDASHRQLYQSFLRGLNQMDAGLSAYRLRGDRGSGSSRLAVRVEETGQPASVQLTNGTSKRGRPLARFDGNRDRHLRLLGFLEKHPLVREISLPGILQPSEATARSRPGTASIPIRDASRTWPKIGIIDGGVSNTLGDWVVGRWGVLDPVHVNPAHGTFIGGLAVAGSALNGPDTVAERDGADLYDVAVYPGTDAAFPSYYPAGIEDFLMEVESAVAEARSRHGIRIFNFSLNVLNPVQASHYSYAAKRLDEIAERHDVVLFISAGNLSVARVEWPSTDERVLAMLATASDDGLFIPAESIRNASVGAINPPGLTGITQHAPARYSRRGPGMRSMVKPDFAHIGGSGTIHATLGHGLYSVDNAGGVVDGCGTSYATPLVAKVASALDATIEGDVSRETLLALLAHHATVPKCLSDANLGPIARQFVGHGMPPDAATILQGSDHQITLVFAARIMPGKQLIFPFAWPASLVLANGKCAGRTKITLVSSPPIDERFGAELMRINIDASLQQDTRDGWRQRLKPVYLPEPHSDFPIEAERIEHGLKWSPTKVWERSTRGLGASSSWRLVVEYLTRAEETMPLEGVPFTAILTIEDPAGEKPVFNEMRLSLQSLGVQVSDIRTAARVTARV